MVEFHSLEQLRERIGQELAVSDWMSVTQERIDRFAEATDDRQWIHVDRVRAAASVFRGTIAHGFLTLALLPHFLSTTLRLPPAKMLVNYGVNKVRFTAPIPAGKRIRARIGLLDMVEVQGGARDIYWKITIEVEGSDKPACHAEPISRFYAA